MTRIKFDIVELQGERSGVCSVCGKRRRRRVKFWQSINQWNLNKSGTPKSRSEIGAELSAELDAWYRSPFVCAACNERRHQEPTK